MIIGDLDLDWAAQDPGYLAWVKAFLVSTVKDPAGLSERSSSASPAGRDHDSAVSEHALR